MQGIGQNIRRETKEEQEAEKAATGMVRTKKPETPLSEQLKRRILGTKETEKKLEYDGDFGTIISTGSTLLDLAISGGRVRGGGVPGGILVEIFGPSGSGKTVLLAEMAGAVQRQEGEIKFADPEARLDRQFAKIFDLQLKNEDYSRPDTVPELFAPVRTWKPKSLKVINGIFGDSLAALSTEMEMEKDAGDKMGMRRAKEFSEECRKTCRILAQNNYLMVCSNQVRENIGATEYQPKYNSPGGMAIGFYASLRLRTSNPVKIKKCLAKEKDDKDEDDEESKKKAKNSERVVGVRTEIEVFKSSIWEPFHTAPLTILFRYGIDDIRENLRYIKENTKNTVFALNGNTLSKSLDEAIDMIEKDGKEEELRDQVIDLWEEIEKKFDLGRKPKR
jgi:RecA/RadA recombinase